MVKLCADELAVTLSSLVYSSFKCITFPNDMKHTEIIFLLKTII